MTKILCNSRPISLGSVLFFFFSKQWYHHYGLLTVHCSNMMKTVIIIYLYNSVINAALTEKLYVFYTSLYRFTHRVLGSCILWGASIVISVDISVDASVDMSVATRSSIDRVSVDTRPRYRPTVGRVSVEYRPCVDLHVGQYVCRPIWL